MNWGNTNCLLDIPDIWMATWDHTSALICMCNRYNYMLKLGKQFHLHFCTWPSVLQGLKIRLSTFYLPVTGIQRTFSSSLPFPSLVSFCTAQHILGLDPNSGCEPEPAHFPMPGNDNFPSSHEYCVHEFHLWQRSSQTRLTSEWNQISWPGN